MGVRIEMSMDLKVVIRSTYSVLDFISDVGGVQSILISVFASLLSCSNYKHADNFMASKLFRIEKDEQELPKDQFDRSEFFKPSKISNFKHYLLDALPKWLTCCKLSR